MPKFIFLDSSPLSALAPPAAAQQVRPIVQWVRDCDAAGHRVIIPEIVDYEVRREFIRAKLINSVAELDRLKNMLTYLPLTTVAMLKAAELWATVRQQGKPTAHDQNIDVDVILAAQVLTLGIPPSTMVVATVNTRHLSLFVPADEWAKITP